MKSLNIILATSNELSANKLRTFLQSTGLNILDTAKDGSDCLRKVRALKPDLVLIDFDIIPTTVVGVAKIIDEDNICSGILMVNEAQKSLIEEDFSLDNFICLVKPMNKSVLLTSIELITKTNKKIKALEQEVNKLKNTLETRKEIEKAKGILMKQYGLSEQEAFRRMQKQSMAKGILMKNIAKAIVLSNDI